MTVFAASRSPWGWFRSSGPVTTTSSSTPTTGGAFLTSFFAAGHTLTLLASRVAGGLVTAPEQTGIFESILGNASVMDTGFIVLQHDLYEVTVDLAMGFTLDAALSHQPAFKVGSHMTEALRMTLTDLF
jgi:hypothetical protein